MNHLMKFIKTNLNKKWLYKAICLFFIIWFFIGIPVFAQNQTTTTTQDSIRFFGVAIETILSLLSRLWIFLASIAGKLMTNDRVYGSAFHLDIYLWKLWNIMKNFANFALAALVLVEVVKIAIGKSKEWVSKIFVNTLIAAVLIQASWFVMWAVIDISNITVSAVGSFPRIFMQEDENIKKEIENVASGFHQFSYEIDLANNKTIRNPSNTDLTQDQKDNLIQSILPDTNSVSGPLIFMWASIFRFNEATSIVWLEKVDWGTITLSITMKLLVIVFYTIALLFLVVANIIRIWFLWMFIVLSPIIVLYLTFLKKWSDGITKYFDISSVLKSIFKPTIFVWYISLMLIVLLLVKTFLLGNPDTEIWWVQISADKGVSKFAISDIWNVEVKWNLFADSISQGQSMFSEIVVFLLWIFLMRQLVKLALKDDWPVWKAMDSIWINYDLMKWAMSNMPVLPGWFWIGNYKNALTKQTKETLKWVGIKWNGKWDFKASFDKEWEAQLEWKIQKALGIKPYRSKDIHWEKLESSIGKNGNFWWESRNIANEIQWWLSINNPEWMWYFRERLEKDINNKNKFGGKTLDLSSDETMKQFFKEEIHIKQFHEYMEKAGFRRSDWTTSAPKTYEDLRNITYWTVEKTE